MCDRSIVGVKFPAKMFDVSIRLRFVSPGLELAIFQTAAIEHVSNAENGEQLASIPDKWFPRTRCIMILIFQRTFYHESVLIIIIISVLQ